MDYQLIPLAHEHLGQAAEIERLCFSDPWSEKMLAEHLATPLLPDPGGGGGHRPPCWATWAFWR